MQKIEQCRVLAMMLHNQLTELKELPEGKRASRGLEKVATAIAHIEKTLTAARNAGVDIVHQVDNWLKELEVTEAFLKQIEAAYREQIAGNKKPLESDFSGGLHSNAEPGAGDNPPLPRGQHVDGSGISESGMGAKGERLAGYPAGPGPAYRCDGD